MGERGRLVVEEDFDRTKVGIIGGRDCGEVGSGCSQKEKYSHEK